MVLCCALAGSLDVLQNDYSKAMTMVKSLESQKEKNLESIRSLQDSLRATEQLKSDVTMVLKQRESDLYFERAKMVKTTNVCGSQPANLNAH